MYVQPLRPRAPSDQFGSRIVLLPGRNGLRANVCYLADRRSGCRKEPGGGPAGACPASGRNAGSRRGQSTGGKSQDLRCVAQQFVHDERHHVLCDQPRRHPVAAPGRQPARRESAAGGARGLTRFSGERPASCPQRSRQRAIPDQRRHAARWRHRLWEYFGNQSDRRYLPRHRRAASRVRVTHGRPCRYHDPDGRLQQ